MSRFRSDRMAPARTAVLRFAAVFAAAALLVPAIAAAGGVQVDYDKEADFSGRKTWAWKAGTEAPNPLTEQKIHYAVEAQMRAKGLTKVDSAPDLWVVTHTSVSSYERINVETFGYGGYYGWNGWNTWGAATTVRIQDQVTGVLLVDILDRGGDKLIWRGVTSEKIPDVPNPDKIAKKVSASVAKMFEQFPPAPPKKK